MKLIDKDAVVAEIERRTDELYKILPDASEVEKGTITISDANNTGKYTALESFGKFINTLEVKQVNVDEQDIYSILYFERIVMRESGDHEYSNESLCKEILKRFKAQKGEEI